MPSAVSGRQWPAESPAKKMPSSVGRAQLVRDPVALVAHRLRAQVLGELDGVVLHVEAGVERADADPQLVAGREAPAVAGGHDLAVDPDRQVLVGAVRGAPRGRARAGRPAAGSRRRRPGRDASRARRRSAARSRRRGRCARRVAGAAVDLGGLELAVGLVEQQLAQLAVVEGRERPRQRPAARCRRACAPRARRRSGGASPSAPSPRARRWGCRRRRSGARRSRSGRS